MPKVSGVTGLVDSPTRKLCLQFDTSAPMKLHLYHFCMMNDMVFPMENKENIKELFCVRSEKECGLRGAHASFHPL